MDENIPPRSSKGKGGKRTASLPIRQQPVQRPLAQRPLVQRPPSTAKDGLWESLGRDIGNFSLGIFCKRPGHVVRLPLEDLEKYGILHGGMSGKGVPDDGTQSFFSILAKEDINRYDEEYGLSTMDRVPEVEGGTQSNWDYAFWFNTYLECCLEPEHLVPGDESAIDRSTWAMRYSDRREKIGYENKLNIDNHWNAFFVLYDKTSRVPHLITVVGDNNEITDGTINDSEVFAALKLCTIAHCKKEFKAHKIVPVAVITISGQRLRLVQGYADPETCKFRLYIAKIAVDDGKRDRWELHSLILAWLLSKPVGTTT